jgi:hypothetical protein
MKPLLTRSELTGRVYVVTAYKSGPSGTIVASRKHDVTDQFERLALNVPDQMVIVRRAVLAHLVNAEERLSTASGCGLLEEARSALLGGPADG